MGVVYTTACEGSGLFNPSKAQGTVPALEIQAEFFILPLWVRSGHLTSGSGAP